MGGPGWKRALLVVLVGIVMGVSGLGSLPEAHASPCGDCYDRPDRGGCAAERSCGRAEKPSGCQDCYDRPNRETCSRESACARDDKAQGCGDCYRRPAPCRDCYDRDRPCRDAYRGGPCDYDYDDDDSYDYGYGCAP